MNSSIINRSLYSHFDNYNYRLFNSYIYDWESDFFGISSSGYSVEVEIKISKSDFKADYKKITCRRRVGKHEQLLDKSFTKKPNKYYFACPEGLIKPDEIDDAYGLIYVLNPFCVKLVRDAKFFHKEKILDNKYYLKKLLDKFYYRNIELRQKLSLHDWDVKHGQKRLEFAY